MTTIEDVVRLMNPNDKMFGWNLLYILDVSRGTIEFRRGAASTSAKGVFVYVEVSLFFVKAAVQFGDPRSSKGYLRLGNLKWFIEQAPLEQAPILYNCLFLGISVLGQEDKCVP